LTEANNLESYSDLPGRGSFERRQENKFFCLFEVFLLFKESEEFLSGSIFGYEPVEESHS
jgi:hypothetical protein